MPYEGSVSGGFESYLPFEGGFGQQPVVYRGTVTGLGISGVDGNATESGGAFIDGANASITALADGNHQIEIYDSAGRMIKGVLKAAGSAETAGSELITSWTNNVSYPYETFTPGIGTNISSAINNTATYGVIFAAINGNAGCLYKYTADLTVNSIDGPFYIAISASSAGYVENIFFTNPSTGSLSKYKTNLSDDHDYFNLWCGPGAIDFSIINNSLKQVLTPSTSGSTIVSAKAGTLFNFAYKNASFDYGGAQTSCTVIVRKLR